MIRTIKKLHSAGGLGLVAFAFAMMLIGGSKPPSPPIVQEEGIKVLTYNAPITGGMTMTWKTTDNRIVLGQDEFIIKCRERQIPARTGWSAWREIGRTKEPKISKDGFWRNRDIQLRIEVEKGAIE